MASWEITKDECAVFSAAALLAWVNFAAPATPTFLPAWLMTVNYGFGMILVGWICCRVGWHYGERTRRSSPLWLQLLTYSFAAVGFMLPQALTKTDIPWAEIWQYVFAYLALIVMTWELSRNWRR